MLLLLENQLPRKGQIWSCIVNFPHFLRAITFKYGSKADVTGMSSENSFLGSLGDRTGAVSLEPLKVKFVGLLFSAFSQTRLKLQVLVTDCPEILKSGLISLLSTPE